MMKKIFEGEISEILEVYINDMTIKYNEEQLHNIHLTKVFNRIRQTTWGLTWKKYLMFQGRQVMRFYLTERGFSHQNGNNHHQYVSSDHEEDN